MEQMKALCICSFPSLWHNHNASFKKGLTPTAVLSLFMLLYFVNKTTPVIYDVEKFVCALFLDYFFFLPFMQYTDYFCIYFSVFHEQQGFATSHSQYCEGSLRNGRLG